MKAIIIAALVLLIPASILAQPTLGIFFTYEAFDIYYSPSSANEQFDGYLYAHNVDCYLTAAEFQLVIGHPSIWLGSYDLIPGWINLGTPEDGISISGWPPLDGWTPGYNLLGVFHFLATEYCECFGGGTLAEVPIQIVPHPDTGIISGTCWPDNDLFAFVGLTSVICPVGTATEESSWGAIKSMVE